MDINHIITAWLWPAALGTIPVAVVVALVCRTGWCRASTRHALWLVVLTCLLVTPIMPRLRLPSAKVAQPETKLPTHVAVDPAPANLAGPAPESVIDVPALPRVTPPTNELWLAGWVRELARTAEQAARETPAPEMVASAEPSPVVMPRRESAQPRTSVIEPLPRQASVYPPAPILSYTAPSALRDLPALAATTPAPVASAGTKPSLWATATGWIDTAAWKKWIPKVQALRDAVATLPPVPTVLWIGGGGLILAVIGGRTLAFRRVLKRSSAAPAGVRLMVQQAAKEIGLKRTPAVLMTEQRVSPMVWCGLHCRLVLPSGLWEELDDIGRRAVILHELAHLRRRDHWVRWAEMVASVAYWWHPVVWWVRGRLRDEADLCCDAWVTALLPRERRAYAMALVSTQSYLSQNSHTPPSMGMGVMTSSAERFARRLTMVMKARPNPRLSALGVIASLGLGIVASSSASLWACPPEDEKPATTKVSQPEKAKAPKPAKPAKAPKAAVEAKAAEEAAVAAEAHEAYSAAIAQQRDAVAAAKQAEESAVAGARRAEAGAGRAAAQAEREAVTRARAGQPGRSGGDSDARIRELEVRLERLDAQLERLQEMLERSRSAPRSPLSTVTPAPGAQGVGGRTPHAAAGVMSSQGGASVYSGSAPALLATPRTPQPSDVTVTSPRSAARISGGVAASAPRSPQSPAPAMQPGDDVRLYNISGGKLEALWELMSRDDVPVFVSQQEGGIAVHGTEAQHRAFKAFLQIINPEGSGDEGAAAAAEDVYRVEVQNLDALRSLNTDNLAQAQQQLHRHAELLAQRYAETGQRMQTLRSLNDKQRQEIIVRLKEAEKQAKEIKVRKLNKADEAKILLEKLHQDSQTIVQAQQQFSKQSQNEANEMEAKAEALEQQASDLEEKADALADRADELAEKASEFEGEARAAAQKDVRELQGKSKDLAKQARDMNKQAEALRKQAEALEQDAEKCEDCCSEEACEPCDEAPDCEGATDCTEAKGSDPLALAVPTQPLPVVEVPVVTEVPTSAPSNPQPVLPPALPH